MKTTNNIMLIRPGEVVDITFEQMESFAGNMLVVSNNLLVMSQNNTQKIPLAKYCEPVPLSISIIETVGGGSARCMIAEIFLQ
jgi:hypothetical protein